MNPTFSFLKLFFSLCIVTCTQANAVDPIVITESITPDVLGKSWKEINTTDQKTMLDIINAHLDKNPNDSSIIRIVLNTYKFAKANNENFTASYFETNKGKAAMQV